MTAGYFSSARLQISSPCQYLPGTRCAAPGWLNVMHVVAKLMFFSKEPKNTALSLRRTANGHFHVAALAKLTNASNPDNPSRDCGKTCRVQNSRQNRVCASFSEIRPFAFSTPEGRIMLRCVKWQQSLPN